VLVLALIALVATALPAAAQNAAASPGAPALPASHAPAPTPGGEVNIPLPSLERGSFFGMNGHQLLLGGFAVTFLGLMFGLWTYLGVRKLPVHRSMAEISELIYETCKAYLIQQGKLLLLLEVFIGVVIVAYFALIGFPAYRIGIVLVFSLIGMGGSYGVAWYASRITPLPNAPPPFGSLEGRPYPVYAIPLRAGMSVGMMLISVELLFM